MSVGFSGSVLDTSNLTRGLGRSLIALYTRWYGELCYFCSLKKGGSNILRFLPESLFKIPPKPRNTVGDPRMTSLRSRGFFLPWFSHTSCALRISHISRKYRCAERRQRKERPASLQQRQHLSELCRLICRVYLFIEFFHSLSGVGLVAPEESLPAEVDPSRRTIIFIVADGIHFRLNCFDISHRNRGGNDGHRDRITARLGWYKNT